MSTSKSGHRTGHRSIKEPIAGPWDWRRLLPSCNCELDSLRSRAAVAAVKDPSRGIYVPRFMQWVEGQAKGEDVGPRSFAALSKYRRFLYELNVDHEPAHPADVVVAELPCRFVTERETAENPRSDVLSTSLAA